MASMMHRQETVECLRKFNARRKLKVSTNTVKHTHNSLAYAYNLVLFALTLGSYPHYDARVQELFR